jgi:hypothetical protein
MGKKMSPWIDPDLHEVHKKQSQNLIQMLEGILDFKYWGFQRTYVGIAKVWPFVIYDSKWCRVRFGLRGGEYSDRNHEMSVLYGRLHAPNDAGVMIWNGEECFCWHRWFDALNFLDGLSAREAVEQIRGKDEWPRVAEKFKQSKLGKELARPNHPEWMTRMQAAIWQAYGERLFELFDLRNPDLWNQYRHFVGEYYRYLLPGISARSPGYDKIC